MFLVHILRLKIVYNFFTYFRVLIKRIAAFKPAQSPPEVKIPILFMAPRVYEKSYEKLNN